MQNRVPEIRSLLPVECWRHCLGIENPAELRANSMWRDGPCIPPPSVWTSEDEGVQCEELMPLDCVAELCANEKHSIVGLLTRDTCMYCVKIQMRFRQTRVILNPIMTQVMRLIQSAQEESLLPKPRIEYSLNRLQNHRIEPDAVYKHVVSICCKFSCVQ